MNDISDTQKLSNAVNGLVLTITQIINGTLQVVADAQDQKIARRLIEAVLTKEELAEHLKVSKRTVENWMCRGQIPYYRIGKNIRFKLSDIESHWNAHYRIAAGPTLRVPHRARRGI